MITKLIHVTQEDISMGCRAIASNCPVALAISRELGQLSHPLVWPDLIYFWTPSYSNGEVKTPRSVERFIKRFDKGEPVGPFNFYLRYEGE